MMSDGKQPMAPLGNSIPWMGLPNISGSAVATAGGAALSASAIGQSQQGFLQMLATLEVIRSDLFTVKFQEFHRRFMEVATSRLECNIISQGERDAHVHLRPEQFYWRVVEPRFGWAVTKLENALREYDGLQSFQELLKWFERKRLEQDTAFLTFPAEFADELDNVPTPVLPPRQTHINHEEDLRQFRKALRLLDIWLRQAPANANSAVGVDNPTRNRRTNSGRRNSNLMHTVSAGGRSAPSVVPPSFFGPGVGLQAVQDLVRAYPIKGSSPTQPAAGSSDFLQAGQNEVELAARGIDSGPVPEPPRAPTTNDAAGWIQHSVVNPLLRGYGTSGLSTGMYSPEDATMAADAEEAAMYADLREFVSKAASNASREPLHGSMTNMVCPSNQFSGRYPGGMASASQLMSHSTLLASGSPGARHGSTPTPAQYLMDPSHFTIPLASSAPPRRAAGLAGTLPDLMPNHIRHDRVGSLSSHGSNSYRIKDQLAKESAPGASARFPRPNVSNLVTTACSTDETNVSEQTPPIVAKSPSTIADHQKSSQSSFSNIILPHGKYPPLHYGGRRVAK